MAQNLTEGTNLNVGLESSLGTLPSTGWYQLQPNSYGDVGPSYKKISRTPISKNRQDQKSILVDLDSNMPWQSDFTKDFIDRFAEGIFMSAMKHSGGTGASQFTPTAISATAITVAALGNLQQNTLIYIRGTASNDGLKPVGAGSTGTSITIAGGTVETPPGNATVEVAGWQGTATDIGIDVNGNLTSTAADFTTMGLNVGQWIRVGDLPSGAAFAFANTAYVGFARVKAIAAHLLTLERRSWTVGAADPGTGKTIRLLFSRWIRNVAIDHADYKQSSYSFEITYPTLSAGGAAEYEYVVGNMLDSLKVNIPLTAKATVDASFKGTTSNDPTVTRQTGASTALAALAQVAMSSSTDVQRLRISNTDETGISTDMQNVTLTISNNVSPEKQLGVVGATKLNVGRFQIDVEADLIFTSDDVVKAVHDGRTARLDVALRNSDFGVLFDVMSLTVDDTNRQFPTNQSVTIKSKLHGFQDATLGSTLGMSVFAYLPAS